MLKLRPNPGKPPRGLKWKCAINGIGFEAKTYEELKGRVLAHAEFDMRPALELEQEMLSQIAESSPWLVQSDKTTPIASAIVHYAFPSSRTGLKFVEDMEYELSAAICKACPHNKTDFPKLDAGERMLYIACRGKVDAGLGYCEIHKHHNALACWLERPGKRRADAPEECWMK